MTAQLKLVTPKGYHALTPETVADYIGGFKASERLGGKPSDWKT